MYSRSLKPPQKQSFFLLGPRGIGKTSWLKANYKDSIYIDLLDDEIYRTLLAQPNKLQTYIGTNRDKKVIIIDEVQKLPKLLDEVHRLIESKKYQFILTGSSARKLKKDGVNLLAGRALKMEMFPLTCQELGKDFDLKRALRWGNLPMAVTREKPKAFLNSYVNMYIKEEIQLEGLTRSIENFARFLQIASFSQGAPLVASNVASESAVNRKVVEDYFSILRDLMLSIEIPVFTKRAKRDLIAKTKFYFFDVGVFRTLRPKGPLDSDNELNGQALETLVLQEIKALNHYMDWGYEIFYWHTRKKEEVDFVLYGEKGLWAIEVKAQSQVRAQDIHALQEFKKDYPEAQCLLVYLGSEKKVIGDIQFIPAEIFFKNLAKIIG